MSWKYSPSHVYSTKYGICSLEINRGLKYAISTFIYRVKALYKSYDRVVGVLTLPRPPDLTLFGIVSLKEQRALIR